MDTVSDEKPIQSVILFTKLFKLKHILALFPKRL